MKIGWIGLALLVLFAVAPTMGEVRSSYSKDYNFSINLPDIPTGNSWLTNYDFGDENLTTLEHIYGDELWSPLEYTNETRNAFVKMWDGWFCQANKLAFYSSCMEIGCYEFTTPINESNLNDSMILDHAICLADDNLMQGYLINKGIISVNPRVSKTNQMTNLQITNSTFNGQFARLFEVDPTWEAISFKLNATEIAVIEARAGLCWPMTFTAQDIFNNTTVRPERAEIIKEKLKQGAIEFHKPHHGNLRIEGRLNHKA